MGESIYTVNLPDIGEGVVEGEVIEWLKNVGDTLKQDEPVVVVMTDKATVELPAPFPGVLVKQYYQPGETSFRDKPLYDIQTSGQTTSTKISVSDQQKEQVTPPSSPSIQKQATSSPKQKGTQALPKVRHMARELGMDLSQVQGSGKEGRILASDLASHSADCRHPASKVKYPDSEELPLVGVRGVMAKKMQQSIEIPQFSYFEQVEVVRLMQMRQNIKKKADEEGLSLSYMPFFIRALSLCASKYPLLNSSIDMDYKKVYVHRQHNIGIAIASDQGLIVPVLKGMQGKTLEEIVRAYDGLKNKALKQQFEPSDMREATMTISNFGALEGDGLWATPMINSPEVAILAIGHIRPQAVVRHREVSVREILTLSWSFDHRVIDGSQAAAISHYFCSLVREPAALA